MATSGRGIGWNELSPALQEKINAGGTGGVVITTKSKYTHTVSYNQQAVVRNIVFVDGVDIVSFNPETDVLSVYKNGTRLIEGVDYRINANNVSIDAVSSNGWVITDGVYTRFTFEVEKNTNTDADSAQITSDLIAPNAITINQLDSSLRTRITTAESEIDTLQSNVSGLTTEMNSVKTSVSDGKKLVAAAITDKGVSTAATATFKTMSDNIAAIHVGVDPVGTATAAQVLQGYTFSNAEAQGLDGAIPVVTPAASYSPGTSNKTIISKGSYVNNNVVLAGDADLSAGNIKTGVNIFGVGGTFTADATAAASSILAGSTAYVNGAKVTGTMVNKSGTTTAWSGYETVSLQAHPSDGSQGLLTVTNSYNYPGYYDGTSKITTNISNLNAANIKYGVAVGRNDGSAANCITGTFTSDANATAAQILSGRIAYVKGSRISGTIGSKGAATYTPGTSNQTITAGQYLSGAQTIAGSSNLVASNIKSGVKIFNVTGNLTVESMGGIALKSITKTNISVRAYCDGERGAYDLGLPQNIKDTIFRIQIDGSVYAVSEVVKTAGSNSYTYSVLTSNILTDYGDIIRYYSEGTLYNYLENTWNISKMVIYYF